MRGRISMSVDLDTIWIKKPARLDDVITVMNELLGPMIDKEIWKLLKGFVLYTTLDSDCDVSDLLPYDSIGGMYDGYQYDKADFDLCNYNIILHLYGFEYSDEMVSIDPVLADWLGWYISAKLNATTLTRIFDHDQIFSLYKNGKRIYSDRTFYKDYFEKRLPDVRWIPKEYCQSNEENIEEFKQ